MWIGQLLRMVDKAGGGGGGGEAQDIEYFVWSGSKCKKPRRGG